MELKYNLYNSRDDLEKIFDPSMTSTLTPWSSSL
jgi:hypothetical protein